MPAVPPETASHTLSVPRETEARLQRYVALLREWQTRMNLVGPATLDDAWQRHIVDSLQLLDYAPAPVKNWVDIGSGAGLPGLVVAIARPGVRVVMVEARAKKCMFLEAVRADLGLANVEIRNQRIEDMAEEPFDIISARALAALATLFDWGRRFQGDHSLWILPKGRQVEEELHRARQLYSFGHALKPSMTSEDGRILLAWGVRPHRKGRAA